MVSVCHREERPLIAFPWICSRLEACRLRLHLSWRVAQPLQGQLVALIIEGCRVRCDGKKRIQERVKEKYQKRPKEKKIITRVTHAYFIDQDTGFRWTFT